MIEKCLYLNWSPHHKETHLGMTTRREIQRWKEHWRNNLLSPQNHELPHYPSLIRKGRCSVTMSVLNYFAPDVFQNEVGMFERIAIAWFRFYNWPFCAKWIPHFGQLGPLGNTIDFLIGVRTVSRQRHVGHDRSRRAHLICLFLIVILTI